MYNNQYEEYMRNSLGYNMPMMDMNQMGMNQMNMNQMNMNNMAEMYESENNFSCSQVVDDMYPEIYRIIYPMVCKACMAVDENISEDLVSRMVNEIYMNVENMECMQETRGSSISVSPQASKSSKSDLSSSRTGSSLSSSSSSSSSSLSSVRQQETRQRNPLLRDLIRILVLRELLGNPGRPRPPFRPPYRPPFGGGMGPGQGPRPPFPGPQPRSPYEY